MSRIILGKSVIKVLAWKMEFFISELTIKLMVVRSMSYIVFPCVEERACMLASPKRAITLRSAHLVIPSEVLAAG